MVEAGTRADDSSLGANLMVGRSPLWARRTKLKLDKRRVDIPIIRQVSDYHAQDYRVSFVHTTLRDLLRGL